MKTIKPPHPYTDAPSADVKVFLAGTIDMGNSDNWQLAVERRFANTPNLTLFNPRRDDWDSSWKQSINNSNFVEQVTWELDALIAADLIFMYFAPNSKSPVTLMELGLHAHASNLLVCCPEGYWRKGNVDVVCRRYHIPQENNFVDAVDLLETYIENHTPF